MLLVRKTYGWRRSCARLTYEVFTRRVPVKSKATVAIPFNGVEQRLFF